MVMLSVNYWAKAIHIKLNESFDNANELYV